MATPSPISINGVAARSVSLIGRSAIPMVFALPDWIAETIFDGSPTAPPINEL